MRETLICGDIGGTNTRFTLYEIHTSGDLLCIDLQKATALPGEVIFKKKYNNEEYASFADVLKTFLYKDARVDKPPATACLAVAGPVKGNKVRFTNRDSWAIDGDDLAQAFQIRTVSLINDFIAMGYGLLTLDEERECVCLQKAEKVRSAPIACIGAGTGLGECFLTPDSQGQYTCFASEGGHAEFAPRDELEVDLLSYLKEKFQQQHRVSVERVASGTGLANIYEYLSERNEEYKKKVDPVLHQKIIASHDKGKEIATNTEKEVCRKTMDIFVRAYGAEAGVAALKWLPYGGLYLTGGLTPKNIDLIKDPSGPFLTALLDKGRVSGMLCSVPIFAVLAEDLGERGAKYVALQLLQKYLQQLQSCKSNANTTSSKSGTGEGSTEGQWQVVGWALSAGVVGASVAIFAMTTLKLLHHK